MAFFLSEPAPGASDLTAKNRVWGIFANPSRTLPANRRQPQQPRRENCPTATKTASGIPVWPSRDPIEEVGGVNVYAFTENCATTRIDVLGSYTIMFPPPGKDPTAGIVYRLSQVFQGDYLLPRLLKHWIEGEGRPYYLTYGEFSYATRDEDGDPIWNAMEFPEAAEASTEASRTGGCKDFSSKAKNYSNRVTDNSLGHFNLVIEGEVCCIVDKEGAKRSVFSGTIEIRDESFDFDLGKKRSPLGEVKTLVGWFLLRGGGKQFEIHQQEQIDFTQIDGRYPSY